jgi:ketosteroid isomerase-like protein
MSKQDEAVLVVNKYFEAFNFKDLDKLKRLYSDNVVLDEWGTRFFGKQAVLEQNEKLFSAHEKVKIYVLNQFIDSVPSEGFQLVCNEIKVVLWKHEYDTNPTSVFVVDVIRVDDSGLVEAVRAFKGAGFGP